MNIRLNRIYQEMSDISHKMGNDNFELSSSNSLNSKDFGYLYSADTIYATSTYRTYCKIFIS